ncbi:transglutaminase family protein [uncultured Subdoligranulum sp.]|uniref:transglutaminase family protein n=1 Tax=uncultured Subdoligranulum sp. TaxID=512298 RepID=UPI003207E21D
MSRLLQFSYDITLTFDKPVTRHSFVLRCLPGDGPGQRVENAALTLDPAVPFTEQRDSFGNRLQIGRLDEAHSHFHYKAAGTVLRDDARREKEADRPLFRYPSAFTQPDGALRQAAASLTLPDDPRGKAWALLEAVQARLTYTPGVTGVSTTAAQALALGQGVCQDYAHVYLALARLCGLSARYVNGLPEGEGASHAWCEVWLDGVWTGIDPTRGRWADEGYIRFGIGRDFTDCPMERGVFVGAANQCQTVFMQVSQQ